MTLRFTPGHCLAPLRRGEVSHYEGLFKRDEFRLDRFWIKDGSLTDTDSRPAPDILATEIADDLETAFDLFRKTAKKLRNSSLRMIEELAQPRS